MGFFGVVLGGGRQREEKKKQFIVFCQSHKTPSGSKKKGENKRVGAKNTERFGALAQRFTWFLDFTKTSTKWRVGWRVGCGTRQTSPGRCYNLKKKEYSTSPLHIAYTRSNTLWAKGPANFDCFGQLSVPGLGHPDCVISLSPERRSKSYV